ncbi:MAG: hypothetical protein MUO40_14285 [Anaerolineaceae bacterium]|nr:hypothetical protein [Anaerolineaceae bacterium]
MTKKVLTGTLLTLVFVAIVYGAANRTEALYSKSTGFSTQSSLTGIESSLEIEEKDLVTLNVVAETIDNDLWLMRVDDITTIEIEGRTLDYITFNNFTASPGTRFSLVGFYETPDSFEISEITNLDSGETIRIRDINGKPAWGNGRGGH